jgi:outer membrane protein assembly factor BamB
MTREERSPGENGMTKRLIAGVGLPLLCGLMTIAMVATSADSDPAQWPQWRGPFFNGMARTAAPVEFGDAKNVKWKVAVPGRGFSTPVIWGDRIFLTTAVPTGKTTAAAAGGQAGARGGAGGGEAAGEEQKFMVMSLDRKTGKSLWERVAKVATPHEGYHRQYGSFASNSPLTDGKYVYASFGSRGVYCYDFNGKLVWQQDLGIRMRIRLQFGEGGAPALYENMLIIPYDHESGSILVALDKRDGKELWRVSRNESSNWSTPLVVDFKGKKQVVVSATNKVRSYDPGNGKVLWECGGLGMNVIPMPVQQNDVVFAMSGFRDPKLMAIRLGREGDLTNTDAVVWSQTRGTSYTPSPLLHENKLYTLTDNGLVSCFNATTGEPYYHQKRLPQPDSFKASPVGAGDKFYLASESGVVTVLKLGEQFEVLATNTFEDQMFVSSPVVAEGELFLRSKTHLFCVSDGKRSK